MYIFSSRRVFYQKMLFLSLLSLNVLLICTFAKKNEITKSAADLLEKEDKRLTKEKLSCPLTKLSANSVESLRFLGKDHSVTIACVVKILRTSPTDKWFWSVLGDLYQTRGDHSLSNICFKQALKLAGKITSLPKEWHFLGPFVIGKTELDGDPLEHYGGIKNVSKFRTQKSVKYFSELVPDAKVQWKTVTAQILDEHSIGLKVLPQINWNDLVSSLGSLGITEWQGWLVGEFGVNDKELNVLLQCHGVHTLFIDEYVLTGDVYHRESFWFSVPLKKGVHTIKIRLRTKVSQQLKCSLKTAPSSFAVLSPSFLPDILDGYLFSPYVAIPISNYHHSRWVKNIRISVDSHSGNLLGSLKVSLLPVSELAVAPGQTRSVNIELHSSSIRITENCQDAQIKLKISSSEGSQLLPLTLRCRKPHQSFLWTFIDHDGSVQHAAAIEPLGKCDGSITRTDRLADRPSCPVLLTLHGTTVPPQNQADSYKHMVGGEFVFGVREAWILAPTRHGAHNWEGPGALTALTALTRLAEMTEKHDWVEHPASPNHVIFAGHSMGGHGAWHLATHYPDLCLGLVSLAGWIKKEEYGDSNLFFRHDISTSDTDPAVKGIMEACVAENDADRHVSNLKGIPVIVRIGADDRTVHPLFSRRMVRRLAEEGVSVTYRELAGKEHWWWDTRETNDGGAVNDKELRNFVGEVTRGSLGDASSCVKNREGCGTSMENAYVAGKNPPGVEDFTYITMNPAFGGGLKGIRILQQVTPFRISKIKMKRNEEAVTLTTVNVARFSIRESINRPIKWKFLYLKIDGQLLEAGQLSVVLDDPTQHFCRVNGRWEVCEWIPDSSPRGPLTLGPARRVAEAPLIIVTGCQGSESRTESLLNQAVYIANLFHLTSDASVPIIRDKDTDATQLRDSNLIILGNEKENSLTSHFLQNTPITADEDHLVLGKCSFDNPRTGLMTLTPHGDLHLAMLLFGLTPDGMKDIVALATPTIPPMTRSPFSNLLPDFVITGPEFGAKGPGGFECTGFWGNNWEYRPDLVSCSC